VVEKKRGIYQVASSGFDISASHKKEGTQDRRQMTKEKKSQTEG